MIGLARPHKVNGRPARPVGDGLAEHFQAIAHRLRAGAGRVAGCQAVGVTSSTRGEGVSSVAANLAIAAARSSVEPVLLIDANIRYPSAQRLTDSFLLPGLAHLLAGQADLEACLHESPEPNLFLLGAGSPVGQSLPAYEPAGWSGLMDRLRPRFGLIVCDLPAAEESSPCLALAGPLDGILLVVEAERVRVQVARRAQQRLRDAGARVLGVVLNKRRNHLPGWLYRTL